MHQPYPGGRHELGQNFLTDRAVIAAIADKVAGSVGRTSSRIVEIGAGDGALTIPLSRLGHPMTAIEIDPRRARRLRGRTPGHVTVVCDDILRCALPQDPYVLVGNLPFHLTTSIIRRVLAADHWQSAVLLVQWEVARRRAGVGGASMMTARWWPWYDFALHARVPARAFRPVPSVDGGLLTVHRRPRPLVDDRKRYQDFVGRVFTGRGRGLPDILARTGQFDRRDLAGWLRANQVSQRTLPKDLTAGQWASLWGLGAGRDSR